MAGQTGFVQARISTWPNNVALAYCPTKSHYPQIILFSQLCVTNTTQFEILV